MFDLMQYALTFYDVQLILARMRDGEPHRSLACGGSGWRHVGPLSSG